MKRCKLGLILLLCSLLLSVTSIAHAADTGETADYNDVATTHWGYANIRWATQSGIVQGDGQGQFLPNKLVTATEFLVMLIRAYPKEIKLPNQQASEKWYTPYYKVAEQMNWPVHAAMTPYKRGNAAMLIAYAAGKQTSQTESIQYLLDQGLAKGKTANTLAGFKANDSLTRAEAVTFIRNVKGKLPALPAAEKKGLQLLGVALGDTAQSVIDRMGSPARKDPSSYGYTWYIYNAKYDKYAQIGIENNKVVALYSNSNSAWSSAAGIKVGITSSTLASILGVTVKQAALFRQTSANVDTVYYFDQLTDYKLDAILLQNKPKSGSTSAALLNKAYERQVFDLTNVFRLRNGIGLLLWDDLAAAAARKHSQDMITRDYFDHTNPDGLSPFDRMEAIGISYSWAAENIAAGYSDAFAVHNGWLNSAGHRKNMLNDNLKRLGVGIVDQHYTQNFYTPLR